MGMSKVVRGGFTETRGPFHTKSLDSPPSFACHSKRICCFPKKLTSLSKSGQRVEKSTELQSRTSEIGVLCCWLPAGAFFHGQVGGAGDIMPKVRSALDQEHTAPSKFRRQLFRPSYTLPTCLLACTYQPRFFRARDSSFIELQSRVAH